MFAMSLPLSSQFRSLASVLGWLLLLPFGALGQQETPPSTLHAGWQAGPLALQTERAQAVGAHNLGNTGYGQAVTIQAHWKGPWEVEFQGARGHVVTDDGALNGTRTEIQSAAVMVNYTLGGEETQRASTRNARMTRGFQPFVGIGIAHVDHLIKQDLEDHLGRRYHQWSDGTLRDREEVGDHDGQAPILRRDYTYESDVEGDLPPGQRSLAIPAQIGVRMDVSPRVRTRFGVGGWLGLNDNVDGQRGGSVLSGDAVAAGFFGIGIRLGKLGKKLPSPATYGYAAPDAALLAAMDTDGDGVNNLRDRCPGTPKGAMVNENGCAVDSDGDGYADHRDAEPHSKHTLVDARGVALDPHLVSRSADWDTIRGQVASDPADLIGFTLRIPKPETGWTEAEQHSLLAFAHLKETSEAMEIHVGEDPAVADLAVQALETQGITPEVVAPASASEASPTALNRAAEATAMSDVPATPHFRVQLGAFQTPDEDELDALFAGIDVVQFAGDDGLTRVVSRAFVDRAAAEEFQVTMESRGFIGAFLTSHGQESTPATTRAQEADQPQFDADKVRFRIQLGALKERVSTDAMDAFLSVGQVEHRSAPGWHRYLQGDYTSLAAAKAALPALQAAGFADAFVVGDVSGRLVPAAEAIILLQQD